MRAVLMTILLTASSWAATIVSGSSIYQWSGDLGLANSSLMLAFAGSNFGFVNGSLPSAPVGSLGGGDITGGFGFGPAGNGLLQASFQLNGTTYQAGNPIVTNFLLQITTPSSGLCCSQTYNFGPAYFPVSGSITATVDGVTTSDLINGVSIYTEGYSTNGRDASFGKSSSFLDEIPEPTTMVEVFSGLFVLVALAFVRRRKFQI